jgi:tripartite ATP-independent transporter DctP family solute receptor
MRAKAAQFEYKCSLAVPIEHPFATRAVQMWEAVKKETSGRLVVATYPNSILGSAQEVNTQLRIGAVQFVLQSSASFTSAVPACQIESVGYVFSNAQQALKTMQGPLGKWLVDEFAKKNLFAFPARYDAGMFQIVSEKKPIRTVDDLTGLKLIVRPTKIAVDLFRALGAAPEPLPSNDWYTSLQTRLAEGVESPIPTIATFKLYEFQHYLSITNHAWSGGWMVANPDTWKALPRDIQEIVLRNQGKYAALERRDAILADASLTDKIRRAGLAVNTTDSSGVRPRLGRYYTAWKAELGPAPWGMLEAEVGKLA